MRLLLSLECQGEAPYSAIDHFHIQGFIYKLLKDTKFDFLHDNGGFKFFTFSDLYPIGKYHDGKNVKLLVSSPSKQFIKVLYYRLMTLAAVKIGGLSFKIKGVKKFKTKPKYRYLTTATPVILHNNFTDDDGNVRKSCYSFRNDNGDLDFFFHRLTENAVKKYNAYYDDEMQVADDLFEEFEFRKEVAIPFNNSHGRFLFIGSLWRKLVLNKAYGKFNEFIIDCGVGEKNSAGYGMLNKVI